VIKGKHVKSAIDGLLEVVSMRKAYLLSLVVVVVGVFVWEVKFASVLDGAYISPEVHSAKISEIYGDVESGKIHPMEALRNIESGMTRMIYADNKIFSLVRSGVTILILTMSIAFFACVIYSVREGRANVSKRRD
jgi:hypothetical protein